MQQKNLNSLFMIYDCFTFFNELDLLEIRLNELSNHVDKFVIVESDRTFQNNQKPLYFKENKKRFAPFLDKIIHVEVTKHPKFVPVFNPFSSWKMEFHQRNQIAQGLKNCNPDDTIMISDVDEIPNTEIISTYANSLKEILILRQHVSYYYLNNRIIYDRNGKISREDAKENGIWHGTVILPYHKLTTPQKTRDKATKRRKRVKYKIIPNAGWHFSYLGGAQKIIEKLEAFAHTEFNLPEYKDIDDIKHKLKNGIDLFNDGSEFEIQEIDHNYPNYLQKTLAENQDKFQHLILEKNP